MAPFIKFTEVVSTPRGDVRKLHFVNTEHIVDALWDDEAKELFVATQIGKSTLKGKEASEALAILQSL
jgi:hypothetical protein